MDRPLPHPPVELVATVSQKLHGRVHVAVHERFGRPNGKGDVRMATHDLECGRWRDFYHPMYRAAARSAGIPFRVVDRGFPAGRSTPA